MKRKFAKAAAGFLAALTALAALPPATVFANAQAPVTDLHISNDPHVDRPSPHSYYMEMDWTEPTPVQQGTVHNTADNDIVWRNATLSQTFDRGAELQMIRRNVGLTPTAYTFNSLAMEPGSIYGFKVFPYHVETRPDPNNPPNTIDTRVPANYASKLYEHLFLTDIRVEAEAIGGQITVTWDNPRFDNRDVFDGYSFYYKAIDAATDFPITGMEPNAYVTTNNSAVKRNGNKLTYTFDAPGLQINTPYAVRVEPYMGNHRQPFRFTPQRPPNAKPTFDIMIGGTRYPIAFSLREYRADRVYMRPPLYVEDADPKQVRLWWDSLGQTIDPALIKYVELIKSESSAVDENGRLLSGEVIATINQQGARSINEKLTDRPTKITYYQMIIHREPIPNMIPPDDGITLSIVAIYDPGHIAFDPYIPTIFSSEHTPSPGAGPYSLEVAWRAFTRDAYSDEELQSPNYFTNRKLYLDKDIYYDVWISDNLATLDVADEPTYPMLNAYNLTYLPPRADPNNSTQMLPDSYSNVFTQYTTEGVNGFQKQQITDNKVYYIKIVARRSLSGEESLPAYWAHYIPPYGDIAPNPNMIAKPPLQIKKDIDGVDMITDTSVAIEWTLTWFEAYNPYQDTATSEFVNNWFSRVGVRSDGTLAFGDECDGEGVTEFEMNNGTYADAAALKSAFAAAASSAPDMEKIAFRQVSIASQPNYEMLYEIHVVKYDDMLAGGGSYEDYVDGLLGEGNDYKWTHGGATADLSHIVDGLEPNTAYVIFYRPYFMRNGKHTAHYPNYVTATTLDRRDPLDVEPTVPVLVPISSTDTTATVWWETIPGFEYELMWSDVMAKYPDGGTLIEWADIVASAKAVTRDGKDGIEFTVTGLFPDTEYYFWLRALVTGATGDTKRSAWSNPVSLKTKDIEPPDPPKGLGLASADNVGLYNTENGTEYQPVESSANGVYMIIEWLRDYKDLYNTEGGDLGGETGAAGESSAEFLPVLQTALSTYMAKFNGLDPNRAYYVRAKTVLTIAQAAEGAGIIRSYHYVVQLSKTDKFLDVIEITVPTALPVAESGVKMKQKESAWSTAVILRTDRAPAPVGDYDGDKNPNTYPLPNQDFEVTYNGPTTTLTYRFRSDKRGADGLMDNQVDQRFISRLVQNRTYVYDVDMTRYTGRNTIVNNRVIEMPYSVFAAFDERKISLRVKAPETTVTLTPGSLATAEVKGLADLGKGSTVKVTLKMNAGAPALPAGQSYGTLPQQLVVQVISPSRTVEVKNFAKPVKVEMIIDKTVDGDGKNIGAYQGDKDTAGWQPVKSEYNNVTATRSMETTRAAHYSTIALKAPGVSEIASPYNSAMMTVASRLNVKDMTSYTPSSEISAREFNNLVAAVAYNRPSVAMRDELSEADRVSLGKAKLLISGQNVTKEAGIATLVKLYELKTKAAVKNAPSLAESTVGDIAQAEEQYRASLLKAEYVGFLDEDALNPKASLTLGQMMYMLSIIIEDSGM